jgi:hypothetical protein
MKASKIRLFFRDVPQLISLQLYDDEALNNQELKALYFTDI